MRKLLISAAAFAALAAPAAAAPQASVRVEGAWKTLVRTRTVTVSDTPVVKDGNAAHSCAGTSAAGAVEQATDGQWAGTWADGLGYFVSAVMDEAHSGSPDFWSLWVNGTLATAGLCDIQITGGEDILLLVDRCTYDAATQACTNRPATPLVLTLTAGRGGRAVARVASLSQSGRRTPVAGASVKVSGGARYRTDRRGRARITLGTGAHVRAYKSGYVRSAWEALASR